MKNYALKLLVLLSLMYVPGLYAQNSPINMSVSNKPIHEVLELIEQQSDYVFIYDSKAVNVNQQVSLNTTSGDIKEVLDKLLVNTGISYVQKDKTIVLSKKPEAQTVKVTGTVVDKDGEPIIGASVLIQGTTVGTITDIDGNFSLETEAGNKLMVSFVGYTSSVVDVKAGSGSIKVLLKEDTKMIDEVVVIGYGAIRKSDLTGSVASIKMDELNQSTPTLEMSLIGHTPGVEIKQTSGAPGSGTTMRIRGVNSVYSSVEPLYVIDGYPASKDVYINPSDVASIEVLKDAASAAIYGSRASGGVVLITTKRGKEGKAKVDLSYQFSVQQLARKIDMMNSEELLELHKDGYNNAYFDFLRANNLYGSDEERWQHSRNDDNEARTLMGATNTMLLCPDFFNTDIDTDWQDEIFSSAPMHRLNFSVSGGKENYRYMFSLGYLNQDGIISPSNHERITARLNMDMDVTERFSVNVGTNMYYVKEREVRTDGLAFNDGVILNVLGMPTMYPVYREDGSYATGLAYKNGAISYNCFGGENPVALANDIEHRYFRSRYALNADLKYKILKGFDAKVTGGMQISDQIYRYYRPAGNLGQSNNDINDYSNLARASNDRDHNIDYLLEGTLNYNRTIQKHTINAVLGYSMQKKDYDNIDTRGQGFLDDRIPEMSAAGREDISYNQDGTTAVTDRAAWSLMSGFGRVVYNYDNRYTFSGTIRRDGCSRFGTKNRWGTFPSFSAGWNISNEKFWENLQSVSAKLRASWGISGNNNISNYRHIPVIGDVSYNFGSSVATGYSPTGFTDLKLGWEKTKQTNVGIDLGFLDGRINLIANYYYSVTNDLLYQNTVSAISGSTSYWTNLKEGKVYNKGFDLQLDASVIATKDFKWNMSGNISFNRNKVEGLKDEIIQKAQRSQITHITRNGLPIGSFYGMVSEGIITKSDYEKIKIDAQHQGEKDYVLQGPPVQNYDQVYIGDVKWRDVNGDGQITEDDRDIIGNNYPDFSYGFRTTFNYKNLSLSATFDGQYGNDVINFSRYYIANNEGGVNSMTWASDRYRDEENPGNGMVYRANRAAKNLNTKFSTYYVEDGSFFRCTNVTLGYTLPSGENFLKRLGISKAHVYASVDNLFIITDYLGYNPDVDYNSGNLCPGVDFGTYPLSRTWSFGVNLTF